MEELPPYELVALFVDSSLSLTVLVPSNHMARRLIEPTYPSFTLVLNEAFEPFQLPPYDSHYDGGAPPYSAASQTRFGDPLMTTLDYRFSNPNPVPTISWEEFWDPNPDVWNLQAALETGAGNDRELKLSRRRRLSDLVIDLALRIRRKCSIRSLRHQRMTPVVRVSYLDLSS